MKSYGSDVIEVVRSGVKGSRFRDLRTLFGYNIDDCQASCDDDDMA